MHVPLRQAGHLGVVDVEAPVGVRLAEALDHLASQHAHGVLLQPAVTQQPGDYHDLGTSSFPEARRKGLADRVRRKILVLDIDIALARAIMSR